jgi:aminoglycoside phosphotransferase (APT) family kinase protein
VTPGSTAPGGRIGWTDLPGTVRAAVEDIIGEPVVSAVSQPGGFSPGTADRVRTSTGRRAFVKAVSRTTNAVSAAMHLREARITAALPPAAPAPRLLGSHAGGDWVALVLSDVDGRHPRTPWEAGELDAVLRMLDGMAAALTPPPVPDLPTATANLEGDLGGWTRVAADPPADLHPWAARHLDTLREQADRALAALAGDTLVHLDVRADNLLIAGDGTVTLVDWPHACVGPRWLDRVLLLVNVCLHGGHDVAALLRRFAGEADADEGDLWAVLAGLAGYFVDQSRRPPPPGIATVRAFQRVQGEAVISLLAQR